MWNLTYEGDGFFLVETYRVQDSNYKINKDTAFRLKLYIETQMTTIDLDVKVKEYHFNSL